MEQSIRWLRGLAEKGGKGVVNNIDARSLGAIADEVERLQRELAETKDDYLRRHHDAVDRWEVMQRAVDLLEAAEREGGGFSHRQIGEAKFVLKSSLVQTVTTG